MSDYAVMPFKDYENICNAIRDGSGTSDPIVSGAAASMILGLKPTGTKTITQNGTHDVSKYKNAAVNVNSLPKDITKLAAGSFVSQAVSGGNVIEVPHNLGVAPNFYLVWAKPKQYYTTEGILQSAFAINAPVRWSSNSSSVCHAASVYRSGNSSVAKLGSGSSKGVYFTAAHIRIWLNSIGCTVPGVTYYWIAGVSNNLVGYTTN